MAEGVGFEPTDGLPHLLISSQVPLTTQPPFQPPDLTLDAPVKGFGCRTWRFGPNRRRASWLVFRTIAGGKQADSAGN